VKRIAAAFAAKRAREKERKRRRGIVGQREERETEREVRRSAVATARWLDRRGLPAAEAACRLCLSRQALARWQDDWREKRLSTEPIGRPAERPEPWRRNLVIAVLWLFGPQLSEDELKKMFPSFSRGELRELRWRALTVGKKRYGQIIAALRWRKPGRIWALDFMEPPVPVDGMYNYILVARDLASGKLLLSLPVPRCDAKTVIDALAALFLEHGPPLVIKWDNGSAFIAEATRDFLAAREVLALYSPPGLPSYNGSCEAGIGGLRTRTHLESARNDRPGEWTCDDVEAGRLLANETARPRGAGGLTPDEAWARRTPITEEERRKFKQTVEDERKRERAARGVLLPLALGRKEEDSIDRMAIGRALIQSDLLLIRRRRIPQPVYEPKCRVVS
jgi:transposase InsO family protein